MNLVDFESRPCLCLKVLVRFFDEDDDRLKWPRAVGSSYLA